MSVEKRKHKRYEVQQDVFMILNESNILCHLQNLSCAGAYVKVNEQHNNEITDALVGESVEMVFNTEGFNKNLSGKILRRDNSGAAVFLAVFFSEKFDFPFLE